MKVATVLTACGIETSRYSSNQFWFRYSVATVLTACGIETTGISNGLARTASTLQQCLPLAVLKPSMFPCVVDQVLLVATVLTACGIETSKSLNTNYKYYSVATVLTACGIET